MIKILFLGTYLSKITGTKGPGEFVADKLNEAGYCCQIVSCRSTPLFRVVESIGILLTGKYEVAILEVYSSRIIYLTYLFSCLIRFRKIPYIAILHGGAIPDQYHRIKSLLDPIIYYAAKVATPSNYIRQFFEEQGKQLIYLPNPFPIENFSFHPQTPDAPVRLLWVRAFSPVYNPDLAVRALANIREQYPEVTLTMVGPDKSMLAEVRQLIYNQGLTGVVTIVGPVANNKLYEYYQSHTVYLNTTSYESFGLAVMEAAASGIPVVSTPAGEIPMLWEDGKDMLIAQDWTPEALSGQISRLLSEPDLRNLLRKNARKKAEKFDWPVIKPMWLSIILAAKE